MVLRSFSFRLALIQTGVLTIAAAVLLALLYWISIHIPTTKIQGRLIDESKVLEQVYRTQGMAGVSAALDRRAAEKRRRQGYHVLIAPDGHVVARNLPSWPPRNYERWLRLNADTYRDGEEDDHEAFSLDMDLPGGARLILGRDVEDLDRIWRSIRRTVVYFFPGMLLMVVVTAALTSRAIGKRIDSMGGAARRVMDGDLSERLPVLGRGDDFDRLGETLNAMLDRIEASLETVRRVSDSVAHELRTPLARLQAELAELRNTARGRTAEQAERAQAEAERLARMADAVLRISRIEAKRHQAEMRDVDLGELAADAADYHAPLAEARGQTLTTAVADNLHIQGNPDLIFQAVSNLLDNAIKFTPEGGRIELSAANDGSGVLLTVRDTGPGVDPAVIGKVGERFFRAPAASAVPGFGLGLALVTAVAGVHQSLVTFSNAEPGLKVEWRLPRGG